MGIEIDRTRRLPDGRFRCEVTFPCSASYARGTNELLQIEPRAFSAAEQVQQHAERAQVELAKDAIRERLQSRSVRIPIGVVPPFGRAYSLSDDELKAGGTD